MKKKIALSGIQPTGIFTLGNYLGAINSWVKMQEDYDCIFFIANMHSLTTIKDPEYLNKTILKVAAILIACGINTKENILYVQSSLPQHAELSWVLQCHTQFGELGRMTQFKDKSKSNNVNAGLFCYPVLMAADILLYKPDVIPIGEDQKQHLELTKTIAKRFNNLYGETFKIPKEFIPQTGAKIMSLTNPEKKMSKSSEDENSYISVLDSPEDILKKFKKTVTDSGSEIKFSKEKPGISNLIKIYSSISNITIKETEEKFKNISYKDFKISVAEAVINKLQPIQNKYYEIIENKDFLIKILEEGSKKAYSIAEKNLNEIYKKIGIKF